MDKKELIEKFAEEARITKKQSEIFVNGVFDAIALTLIEGHWLEIRDFGLFKIREDKLVSIGYFWMNKGEAKRNKRVKWKIAKTFKKRLLKPLE